MNGSRAVIFICICSIFISVISACQKNKKPAANSELDDETVFSVEGKTIIPTNIQREISVSAVVQSSVIASVIPDKQGTLINVKVRTGDTVVKGQTLAIINASKAGSTFLTSPIIAPVSGQVSEIMANVGNEVSSVKSIMEIIDNASLELRVSVSEENLPFITKNTRGMLMLSVNDALQSNLDIRVLSINKVLSDKSRKIRVLVALSESASHIRSGTVGVLNLILEARKNVIVISKDIIVQRFFDGEFKYGVFVLNDDKSELSNVSFRPLEFGVESHDISDKTKKVVEVITGLAINEVIIVKGYSALADKAKVRIFEFTDKVKK